MAQLLVRNLDSKVVQRLKVQAKSKKKSLEQEAREILTEASFRNSREEFAQWSGEFRAKQPMHTTSAAQLIREDRDR